MPCIVIPVGQKFLSVLGLVFSLDTCFDVTGRCSYQFVYGFAWLQVIQGYDFGVFGADEPVFIEVGDWVNFSEFLFLSNKFSPGYQERCQVLLR